MTSPSDQSGIDVRISSDRTEAVLVVTADVDATVLNADVLTGLVRTAGVQITSTVEEKLHEVIAVHSSEPQAGEHLIAVATPPQDGRNAHLVWEAAFDPHAKEETVEESSDDPVDFYNQGRFVRIEQGNHMATLYAETPGEDGCDVTGGVLRAKPGQALELDLDESVLVDAEGRLIAQVTGVLSIIRDTIRITRVLEVEEYVDFSTGNITFDGSVCVQEGVRDRFVVMATEDITVEGLVESATVIAGANLYLRRGMAARERGQIMIDGDADVGYLNNVRGRIKGDAHVRRELMDCQLVIGGDLYADQGAIVGGMVVVTGDLIIDAIGSDGGTTTTVVLGEAPLLSSQILRLQKLRQFYRMELTQKQEQLEDLTVGRSHLAPSEKERLTELSFDISNFTKKIDAAEIKMAELASEVRKSRRLKVIVGKAIYGRAVLRILGRDYLFEDTLKGPLQIEWNKRREVFVVRGDQRRPLHDFTRAINIAA